ncbi:hypothetical protein SCUCBS95973_007044 [Sporothrix curviconia]|uniref:Uncharacterized protein n=1 Tax=Sporothrix curviconia TaxID=1260050 RepID=A0ABP0CCQ8_9PEZI
MSIYHRYALFYNLQRYLDDVDNLCDLALEGNVVEDVPGHEPSAAPQQAATCKYIYEDPIPDIEPSNSDDIERKEDAQLSTRDDMNGHKQDDPNDDKENRYDRNALDEQHHNDAQFGDVRTEANGHEAVSGVQLDDDDEGRMYELACGLEAVTTQSDRDTTANDPSLAPDASGQSQSADDNASTSTTSTENGQPQFSIKRSQLNRL